MPVTVRKAGRCWVTIDSSGKVHGKSKTKAAAEASARAINAAYRKKHPKAKR